MRFSQVINDLDMKDIPLKGGLYTWSGGLDNQRMARLDRFLNSDDWDLSFGGIAQSLLPRPILDHCPVLLEGGGDWEGGPMPFRFENMWLKADGFKDLVSEWWQSIEVSGVGNYILMEKIKALKVRLRRWNKEDFGRVKERKKGSL